MASTKFLRRFRHQSSLLDKSGELDVASSRPVNFAFQPFPNQVHNSLRRPETPRIPIIPHRLPRNRAVNVSCESFPYGSPSVAGSHVSPQPLDSGKTSPYRPFLPSLSPRPHYSSRQIEAPRSRRYVSSLRPRGKSLGL